MAGEVVLPGLGTATSPRGRWDSAEAFFDFVSYTTPRVIYRYDVATGKSDVWARDDVPFKSDQFEVRQVWYPSRDGTKIPMFLRSMVSGVTIAAISANSRRPRGAPSAAKRRRSSSVNRTR